MKLFGYDITLNNIKSFIQGNTRYLIEEFGGDFIQLEQHIQEQIIYRKSLANKECIELGVCKCNCAIPELFYADKQCEDKCYPLMMNKLIWNNYKQNMNLKIENTDIGNILVNNQYEKEFSFLNIFKSKLKIININTSCGCTSVNVNYNKIYEPDERINIKYNLNTNGKRIGTNNIIFTITIEYNEYDDVRQQNYEILIISKIVNNL